MSTFLRALQKAGLIQMESESESESKSESKSTHASAEPLPVDDLFSVEQSAHSQATYAAETPRTMVQEASSSPVAPNVQNAAERLTPTSFEEIYTAASVQKVPFSAEKALKVLDGLQALEPSARKAAILALEIGRASCRERV
jgi:phosphatidate phosphatase PAH1